jgi:PAS domain S-box-containing protein
VAAKGVILPALDLAVLGQPRRLAAVDRASRVLSGLALPLDGVARLAARLLDVPCAAVCLVAGEDILAGRFGVPEPLTAVRRVPLSLSVGKYVVSADQPVAVPDMAADPDLRGHPLLELGIRSFLGVPLHDTAGEPLGSLCVFDNNVREWTRGELAVLQDVVGVMDPVPARLAATVPALPDLDSTVLLEFVQEAFVAVDVDGLIVGWNRAAENMFGWRADEALGQRMDQLILVDPVGDEYLAEVARRAEASANEPERIRGVARRRDGRRFPVETIAHTLRSPYGPILCGFAVDLSGREDAERDADRHRGFLAALVESVQAMVIACDADGNVVLVNRPLREFYGVGDDWGPLHVMRVTSLLRHPDGHPMLPEEAPLLRALLGETVTGVKVSLRPRGKAARAFIMNARPITGKDGRRLGAVAALQDVTDQRAAERFRACELQVMRALAYAKSVPDACRSVVAALASALDWPYGEVWLADDIGGALGQTSTWSAPGVDGAALAHAALAPGEGLAGRVYRSGEPAWVSDLSTVGDPALTVGAALAGLGSALGLPVRGPGGTMGALILFTENATKPPDPIMVLLNGMIAHLGMFLARRLATGLAAELDRNRDDFIALVGHAMRTPLTSIASYTDLLLADAADWPEQDREMLRVVARHTDNLRGIIDSLLDLAGIESGHLTMDHQDVDLAEEVRRAVARARVTADAGQIQVTEDLPERLMIDGDPHRVGQLLDSLLSNAVMYSPDGGEVRARLVRLADTAELTVTDSGLGVPAEERDRLFRRFFRASNVLDRGIPGVGLGLTIGRAIVEALGGTIAVGGRPGDETGTVVTVRLPVR